MFFGNNRDEIRGYFLQVWEKAKTNQTLEPIEKIIASVITQHPEYHDLLNQQENAVSQDYTPEMGQSNPFLHMGMHIALHEQLQTNRPAGIVDVFQSLLSKTGDEHETHHVMMECLGEALWNAQRNGAMPDDIWYLGCLRKAIRS